MRWIAGDVRDAPHFCHPDDVPIRVWNIAEERLGFPYPIPSPNSTRVLINQVKWSDAIHIHDCLYLINVLTFIVSRRLGKPVLLTQHVGPVPYRSPWKRTAQTVAYRTVGRLLLTLAEQVTFISDDVREWFGEFVPFRAAPPVLMNGVDTQLFTPASSHERRALRRDLGLPIDGPVLLFVGRFVEKKGVQFIQELVSAEPRWSWVLVGRASGRSLRLASNALLLPQVSQRRLRDLYALSDLLILPSIGEGFPLVVQEAMASGTPALICGKPGHYGRGAPESLFFAERDSQSLWVQIDRITSRSDKTRLRKLARQFALDNWGWEPTVERYESLLASLRTSAGTMATEPVS